MTEYFPPPDHPASNAVRHLRQRQLAERWGLSVRTLERWRTQRVGPPFLKLGGRIVYQLQDIQKFEANQRRAPGVED